MNWFDKWFAKKSKYVWDESQFVAGGLTASRADIENLKIELKRLEVRLGIIEKTEHPKKEGEYWFVVQDWGIDGPKFRSEQNEWPPVGTKFVSVKE